MLNTELSLPKTVSQSELIWDLRTGSDFTKLTEKFFEVENESEGPNSDYPKGVSTAMGCPRVPLRMLCIQNISGASAPKSKVTVAS